MAKSWLDLPALFWATEWDGEKWVSLPSEEEQLLEVYKIETKSNLDQLSATVGKLMRQHLRDEQAAWTRNADHELSVMRRQMSVEAWQKPSYFEALSWRSGQVLMKTRACLQAVLQERWQEQQLEMEEYGPPCAQEP